MSFEMRPEAGFAGREAKLGRARHAKKGPTGETWFPPSSRGYATG